MNFAVPVGENYVISFLSKRKINQTSALSGNPGTYPERNAKGWGSAAFYARISYTAENIQKHRE